MIYQWVANHRELMGRMTAWLRWRPPTTYPNTAGQIIALLFLSYIVLWNLNDIKNHLNFVQRLGVESESINSKHTFMPRSLAWIGRLTRIDQMWNMFDDPPKNDRWLVMPGKLADGSEVDLFSRNNGSPNFDKPKLPSAQYPRFRWRKYCRNSRITCSATGNSSVVNGIEPTHPTIYKPLRSSLSKKPPP